MGKIKLAIFCLILITLSSTSCVNKQNEIVMGINNQEIGNGETTLFFIHGNSSSHKVYSKQMNSGLADSYTLHAVDLPGHGDSAKAEEVNVYSMPGYASKLDDYIKTQGLENVVLIGWSLGGHIALEMVSREDHPYKGVVIFGTPPLGIPPAMEAAFLPNEAVNIGFTPEVDEEMAKAYASSFLKKGSGLDLTSFAEDILKTDKDARANLVPSMSTIGYADEVKVIAEMKIPIMVIHGSQEQLVNSSYIDSLTMPTLFQNKVQYIDGAGHAPQVETPAEFNKLLADFAATL